MRLSALERENRTLRTWLLVVGISLLGLFLASHAQDRRKVEAEDFVLRDSTGQVRARLWCTEYGPNLAFVSESGSIVMELTESLLRFAQDTSSPAFQGLSSSFTWRDLEFHDDFSETDSVMSAGRVQFQGNGFRALDEAPRTAEQNGERQVGLRHVESLGVALGVQRREIGPWVWNLGKEDSERVKSVIVDQPFLDFTRDTPGQGVSQSLLHIGVDAGLQPEAVTQGDLEVTENEVDHDPTLKLSDLEHTGGVNISPSRVFIWRHPEYPEGWASDRHWERMTFDDVNALELGFHGAGITPRLVLRDEASADRLVVGTVALTKADGGSEITSPASVVVLDKDGRIVSRLP